MSHEFLPPVLTPTQTLAVSCPPSYPPLVIGQEYRIDGLNQNISAAQGLTNFSILATAIAVNRLSNSVKVIPAFATANDDGWPGQFDYDTCQLTHLTDPFLNDIWGAANVQRWPWIQQRAGIANNYVAAAAFVNIGAATLATVQRNHFLAACTIQLLADEATIFLRSNVVEGSANITFNGTHTANVTVDLNHISGAGSGITINSTVSTAGVSQNILHRGQIILSNTGGGNKNINGNVLYSNSTVNALGDGALVFSTNVLHNSTTVTIAAGNTSTSTQNIADNTFLGGTFDITGAQTTTSITKNLFGGFADINITGPNAGIILVRNQINGTVNTAGASAQVDIEDSEVDGTVNFTNSGSGLLRASTVEWSSIVNITGAVNPRVDETNISGQSTVTVSGNALLDASKIHNGNFSTTGFNADHIYLDNDTTVLVANVVNAVKQNYPNALP